MDALPQRAAPVDLAVLTETSGGDTALRRELLLQLRLYTQRDAESLRRCVGIRDVPAIAMYAHRIKGSCGAIGANQVARVCEDIERLARAGNDETFRQLIAAFDRELERLLEYIQEATE